MTNINNFTISAKIPTINNTCNCGCENKNVSNLGPCAKQVVKATIITTDGTRFVGTNHCENPQNICPRDELGMKTGEGYHLCKEVCNQGAHAEVNAISLAGDKTIGATIYLEGHTYFCDNCKQAIKDAGIAEAIIDKPPVAA